MRSYSIGSALMVAGFVIFMGPIVIALLQAIGAGGWMLLGLLLIGIGGLVTLLEESRSDDFVRRTWTNCANCGRRIDDGAPTCVHCGADR